ncbi:NUDIX domain-containing protein [Arcanobacterium haemolyticum]|nr:NUDIX domain-containing protein [Arcanobacterium haemolyticum]
MRHTGIRRSIEVWICADDDVLLLHVPKGETCDGFWQPITGGIESGETSANAARREIWEETGLRIEPENLAFLEEEIIVPIDETLTISKTLYRCDIARFDVRTNPAEHDGYEWVKSDEVAGWLFWASNKATWKVVSRSPRWAR